MRRGDVIECPCIQMRTHSRHRNGARCDARAGAFSSGRSTSPATETVVLSFAHAHVSMRIDCNGSLREAALPWLDGNGTSIHFELAGNGPSLVLLHEMGGTLDSWDGIFPETSRRLRTLRY